MIVIASTGRIVVLPCVFCFRREQDPEASNNMCWPCYVASLLEVSDDEVDA